jgi:hypothetical protein
MSENTIGSPNYKHFLDRYKNCKTKNEKLITQIRSKNKEIDLTKYESPTTDDKSLSYKDLTSLYIRCNKNTWELNNISIDLGLYPFFTSKPSPEYATAAESSLPAGGGVLLSSRAVMAVSDFPTKSELRIMNKRQLMELIIIPELINNAQLQIEKEGLVEVVIQNFVEIKRDEYERMSEKDLYKLYELYKLNTLDKNKSLRIMYEHKDLVSVLIEDFQQRLNEEGADKIKKKGGKRRSCASRKRRNRPRSSKRKTLYRFVKKV